MGFKKIKHFAEGAGRVIETWKFGPHIVQIQYKKKSSVRPSFYHVSHRMPTSIHGIGTNFSRVRYARQEARDFMAGIESLHRQKKQYY